jgi:hypothetical protein
MFCRRIACHFVENGFAQTVTILKLSVYRKYIFIEVWGFTVKSNKSNMESSPNRLEVLGNTDLFGFIFFY